MLNKVFNHPIFPIASIICLISLSVSIPIGLGFLSRKLDIEKAKMETEAANVIDLRKSQDFRECLKVKETICNR